MNQRQTFIQIGLSKSKTHLTQKNMIKTNIIFTLLCCFLLSCNSNIDKNHTDKSLKNVNAEEIVIDLNDYKNLKYVTFIGSENLTSQCILIDSSKTISSLYNYKKIYNKGELVNTYVTFTSEGLVGSLKKCLMYESELVKEKGNSHILNIYFPTDLWPEYNYRVYFGDFNKEYKGKITDTIFFDQTGKASIRYLNLKKGKNEFLFILDVGEYVRPNGENEIILVYGKHVEMIK